MSGGILILSGPSGSGKSTLCDVLLREIPNIYFSISSTTRSPRDGEIDGKHYYFLTQEQFLEDIQEQNFLEWAEVHTNYYGTSKKPVERALQDGKLVVFDIDVQGHRSIKKYYGDFAKSIFVTTPTKEILRDRLSGRQTDEKDTIELRLMHAYSEMQHIDEFDYLIVNDDIKSSCDAVLNIAKSIGFMQNPKKYEMVMANWNNKHQ